MGCGSSCGASSRAALRKVHVRPNNSRKIQRLCNVLDERDDVELVTEILAEESPTGRVVNLESPVFPMKDGTYTHMLMYAAKSGRLEVVRHLLAEGFTCTATEVVDATTDSTLHPEMAALLRGTAPPFLPWESGTSNARWSADSIGSGRHSLASLVDTELSVRASAESELDQCLFDRSIELPADLSLSDQLDKLTQSEEAAAGVGPLASPKWAGSRAGGAATKLSPLREVATPEEVGRSPPRTVLDPLPAVEPGAEHALLSLQAQAKQALAALAGLEADVRLVNSSAGGGGGIGASASVESLTAQAARVEAFQAEARAGLASLQALKISASPPMVL